MRVLWIFIAWKHISFYPPQKCPVDILYTTQSANTAKRQYLMTWQSTVSHIAPLKSSTQPRQEYVLQHCYVLYYVCTFPNALGDVPLMDECMVFGLFSVFFFFTVAFILQTLWCSRQIFQWDSKVDRKNKFPTNLSVTAAKITQQSDR